MVACAASALLLTAVVLFLAGRPGPPTSTSTSAMIGGTDAGNPSCSAAAPRLVRGDPEAEGPPVILWAVGDVRLFLDGEPVFSPPDAPKHFAPGEHTLRAEAEGHEPFETRIRLDPFTPALVHAQLDGEAGITVVRLGMTCASCETPLSPIRLGVVSSKEPAQAHFVRAAAALRKDDWRTAIAQLEQVSPAVRETPQFYRLASSTWLAAANPAYALFLAEQLKGDDAHELDRLVVRMKELTTSEWNRYDRVVLERWNRLTEQHAALLRAGTGKVGIDLRALNERMEALSGTFASAKNVFEREAVLLSAEENTRVLLAQLVAERPGDCSFQAALTAALAGAR